MGGSFVCSLVATDVCTGRTEAVPLLAREQSLVAAGLEAIAGQLPFPVLGIDSDNDSVFMGESPAAGFRGRFRMQKLRDNFDYRAANTRAQAGASPSFACLRRAENPLRRQVPLLLGSVSVPPCGALTSTAPSTSPATNG